MHLSNASMMSTYNGFETVAVFRVRHGVESETDSDVSRQSESGFEFVDTESDSNEDMEATEEQPVAQDDEDMEIELLVTNSTTDVAIAMVPQSGGIHHPEPWSVPESPEFTQVVLSNPIFLKTLKADEILHFKHVCKWWSTWFNNNTKIIAKVRRQNEMFDWYFPILYKLATPAHLFSWTWSGIWHGTAGHSLGTQPRPLPSLDCVPRIWRKWSHPSIIAIGSGLLLIRFVRDIVNVPVKTYRCKRKHWEPKGFRFRYCDDCGGDEGELGCPRCITRANRNWEPLMVVNPLTKAFRFLPVPPPQSCIDLTDWQVWYYKHVQVLMRADDEANSYEVILFHHGWVLIYSSMSDKWNCLELQQEGPWRRNWESSEWGYNCASAWVGGHLFVADIRYPDDADFFRNPLTAGVLQVFEIDVEAGNWKRYNSFLLRKFMDWIPIVDVTGYDRNEDFQDLIVLRNLELVECMGLMYAVIPARIDEFLHPLEDDLGGQRLVRWSNYLPLDPKYMPLQFFILQLQGDNFLNGVLRIELEPSATGWDYKSRRQNLFDKTKEENAPGRGPNWFSCVVKGSVIWVSCEDYLLQYDVVSGQTRTQVIPVNWVQQTMRFAYRPSFHMKP